MKASVIIEKLKDIWDLKTNVELYDFLEVSKQTLSNFKSKKTEDINNKIMQKLIETLEKKNKE